jgi:hypothetical protein
MINKTAAKIVLNIKKKEVSKFIKKKIEIKGANQPPKKKKINKHEFNNMLVYSPKKNKAKFIAEYSRL